MEICAYRENVLIPRPLSCDNRVFGAPNRCAYIRSVLIKCAYDQRKLYVFPCGLPARCLAHSLEHLRRSALSKRVLARGGLQQGVLLLHAC